LIFEALNDLNNRLEDIELKFNINSKERNLDVDVWLPVKRLSLGIEDGVEEIKSKLKEK